MRRRYGSGRLEVRAERPEDINPMESVANLVDAMLVLACGLMLALIINWNVDVGGAGTTVELNQEQEVAELDGMSASGEISSLDGNYQELGIVYYDTATGKYYMVARDDAAGESGDE